jgi:chitin disaccharide deacetylase
VNSARTANGVQRPKLLLTNADDFGFTRDVNAGIVYAHRTGVLTATTLMANGNAFDDAVQLARENPTLDIGCHLVLIQGQSLISGESLPANWKTFIKALLRGRLDPYRELRAQVEKIVAAGVKPSHFDTHKHTHVTPQVFSAVARLAAEFEVPFIRLPFDRDWRLVGALDRYYRGLLNKAGLRTTDHFLGFRLTDTLREETFLRALAQLKTGSTEFMCHPGYLREELRQAGTRLKETREVELQALTSTAVRDLLTEQGIVLTNYRELARQ